MLKLLAKIISALAPRPRGYQASPKTLALGHRVFNEAGGSWARVYRASTRDPETGHYKLDMEKLRRITEEDRKKGLR
jgi:hypothetical protein